MLRLLLPLALTFGTLPGPRQPPDVDACLKHQDAGKLAAVVACYEPEGARWPEPGPAKLRSVDSLRQFDVSQFETYATDFEVVSARALGERELHGRRVGRASVTYRRGDCTVTATESWALEDGAWKRLDLRGYRGYLLQPDADPVASAAIAELLLARDPFATPALAALAHARALGVTSKQASPADAPAELARTALQVNPDDAVSIGLAIRYAPNLEEARRAHSRLSPMACRWPELTRALIERFDDARALQAFAGSLPKLEPSVALATALRLLQLHAPDRLEAFLAGSGGSMVKAALAKPANANAQDLAFLAATLGAGPPAATDRRRLR